MRRDRVTLTVRVEKQVMKRSVFGASATLAVVLAVNVALAQGQTPIQVVRNQGCGCCLKWVSLLEKAGFKATVTESTATDALKDSKGIPKAVRACHTATVG